MKALRSFILEAIQELSPKQQKELLSVVNGDNFDEIINLIKKYLYRASITPDDFKEFFDRHGLSKLQWGRSGSAVKQFVQLFDENNKLSVLKAIIENDGVISINDEKKFKQSGNIYDFCKIEVNGKLVSFVEEAQEIATWTNSGSASTGPAEILLKFILKEGGTGAVGDVLIRDNDDNYESGEEMEVKAATVSSKAPSGGHAAGQRGKIRQAWSIYWYLDKHLFNLPTTPTEADHIQYFQNKNKSDKSCDQFIQTIKDNKIDDKTVVEKIVEAIAYQYRFITHEGKRDADSPSKTTDIPNKDQLIENGLKVIKPGINYETLKNLVGCIQLYFYSIVEGFQYFIGVLVAKENVEKHSANEGKYVLFKTDDNANQLLDFEGVLKHIYFGQLDSPISPQGRTGKIYFNL